MFGAIPRTFGGSRSWTWYSRVPQDLEEDKAEDGTRPPNGLDAPGRRRAGASWLLPPLWPTMLGTGVGLFVLFAIIMIVLDRARFPPQFSPTLRTVPIVFEPDELFMAEPSPDSNAAWDSLMPSGRGFVLVENPKAYNLGPGIPTDQGPDRYSVSMFHQLHCLGMIREMYFAALHNTKAAVYGEETLSGAQLHDQQVMHIGHCFDYLRQALMCAGDLTLEGAMLLPDGSVGPAGVDGWGAQHRCRSWDQAVDWTLRHRAPHNHTGIA